MPIIKKDVSIRDQTKSKKLKIQRMFPWESHPYQILVTKAGFISATWLPPTTAAKILITVPILIPNTD